MIITKCFQAVDWAELSNENCSTTIKYYLLTGATILTYPSAFTVATGSAGHWFALLKARAIENQCYVVAAAQTGVHNPKRSSYGHACIIDPYGCVIAECPEGIPNMYNNLLNT